MRASIHILKALADETRLRILHVLGNEPLSVNELTTVLELGQSRVSRHLKILSDAGLLESERTGVRMYYGYKVAMDRRASRLLESLELDLPETEMPSKWLREFAGDRRKLLAFLEDRNRVSLDHFQLLHPDDVPAAGELVDESYYRRRILEILPEKNNIIADLGCGAGELGSNILSRTDRLILVDRSSNMLRRAGERCPGADCRLGALGHLPMRDAEADVIIAAMVLHHQPEPQDALGEMARVLRPGGRLIIADLLPHDSEIMRESFADFWLGFRIEKLLEYLLRSGFAMVHSDTGSGSGKLGCLFIEAVKKGKSEADATEEIKTFALN